MGGDQSDVSRVRVSGERRPVDVRYNDGRSEPQAAAAVGLQKGRVAGERGLQRGVSYDVKSMVRIGSSAAGENLCTEFRAVHVPSGESRRVHFFRYSSVSTSMR
jgi:hypothetical protein